MLSSTSGSHWDDSRRGWVSFIGGNELRGREEGGIESVILQVCHVGMIKYVLFVCFVSSWGEIEVKRGGCPGLLLYA